MCRPSSFVRVPALLLLASCVLYAGPVAAQQQPFPRRTQPSISTIPPRTFSVNGMVSDAATNARLDMVTLELHSPSGAVVGTVASNTNGTFHFDNVGQGTYILTVEQPGYQPVRQRVEVFNSPVFGVQIELRKTSDSTTQVNKGPYTVSVRELSIPHKAHSEMQKGLALLYGKSDYRGSLKPFKKAVHEYPDYYEAYLQMGVAYVKLADTANAEKAFRKSIKVSHEKYADAYVGLAGLYLNEHRFADAEPLARNAVQLDSKSWQADSELARALIGLHRPAEAETSAAAAVKLKPDEPTLYLVLANTHIQLHNDRALLDDLNHYLKLAPDGAFAQQARGQRDKLRQALAASQIPPAKSSEPQP